MGRKKYVIVMAAGSGTRMGSELPKQFIELDGKAILQMTIETFLKACPDVLFQHLKMGKTERPLLKGKSEEEVKLFIQESLDKREPFYQKAQYTLNVDLLESYEKIKDSVRLIRELLNI